MNYCPKNIPFGTFYNNTVHSSGINGLWIFPGYHPTVSGNCSDTNPSAAKFENYTSYSCQKGAEWIDSNSIQFRNMLSFDQSISSLEARLIHGNANPNTYYESTFYSDSNVGALIYNCTLIGNSDITSSSNNYSITPDALVLPWDRGLLVESVKFYNYPGIGTDAIRGPIIGGVCE